MVNKNRVSNFLRSIGHLFSVRSNCWGPVVSETSVFGPQNLALCEVLGSKCDKNKCGKYSGKFVKLVCARQCRLSQRLLNNAKPTANLGIWCEFLSQGGLECGADLLGQEKKGLKKNRAKVAPFLGPKCTLLSNKLFEGSLTPTKNLRPPPDRPNSLCAC